VACAAAARYPYPGVRVVSTRRPATRGLALLSPRQMERKIHQHSSAISLLVLMYRSNLHCIRHQCILCQVSSTRTHLIKQNRPPTLTCGTMGGGGIV
jgi:hypothetical protein